MRNNLSKKIMQHRRRSDPPIFRRVLRGTLAAIFFSITVPDIAPAQICTGGIPVNQADSSALVAFHTATGGVNWTYPPNAGRWREGLPVTFWFGVSLQQCRVRFLSLSNRNLVGTLPNELGNLPEATFISITNNAGLLGSIPTTLGNLKKLETLALHTNSLSGEIPVSLGELPNLRSLNLGSNQLTGSIPPDLGKLGNLSNLEILQLFSNKLDGSIPAALGDLSKLRDLVLSFNQLSGVIPPELGKLINLGNLDLSSNQLSGAIPAVLGNLTNLIFVRLNSNQLSGEIPASLGNLTNLQLLWLNNNQLSGAIPAELGKLTNLQFDLNLASNRLTGVIPAELGKLTKVQTLVLLNNQLTGSIPTELGNLTNALSISLSNNKLTGAVPASFANLTKLTGLFLQNNQLEELPNLTGLSALRNLWLENNRFTFEDLEPNAPLFSRATVRYSPQDSVETTLHRLGTDVILSVEVGGQNNLYQWFKNNVELSGATEPNLTIEFANVNDPSKYHCKISNTVVTGLNIFSHPLALTLPNLAIKAEPGRNEIKLGGDLTAIKASVIDPKTGLLKSDFNGIATYRILKKTHPDDKFGSTEGIGWRLNSTLASIENGVAQDVFFETTQELFAPNKPITPQTVLAGSAFVEICLQSSGACSEEPGGIRDTVEVKVKSPFDFSIKSIDIQQGVIDADKLITLEFRPGETKDYEKLKFIAEHETAARVVVGYKNTVSIPFSRIEGIAGISCKLTISRGQQATGILDESVFGYEYVLRDLANGMADGEVNAEDYSLSDRKSLKDALTAPINSEMVKTPDTYTFEAVLSLPANLSQLDNETMNDAVKIFPEFIETKPLRILAVVGYTEGAAVPTVPQGMFAHIMKVYPVQQSKLVFNDPNDMPYDFELLSFYNFGRTYNRAAGILNLYNDENPSNQRDKILVFVDTPLLGNICGENAGGCAHIRGVCAFTNLSSEFTIAHEIGHTLGLGDTYTSQSVSPFHGDHNPRRSDATENGNFVENGNIILGNSPLESAIKTFAAGTNQPFNPFFDFMGSGSRRWVDRVSWDFLYHNWFVMGATNTLLAATADGFIAISGLIDTNAVVTLNPFIMMSNVPGISTPQNGAYSLEFTDDSEFLLNDFNFDVEFQIPEVGNIAEAPFSFYLPLPARTAKIVLKKDGAEIASRIFSKNPPTIRLTSPSAGESIAGVTTIRWTASDPDGDALTYNVLYSPNGQEQIVVEANLKETAYQWDSRLVPQSASASLTMIANDGINEGRATSGNLVVSVDSFKEPHAPSQLILLQNYPNPFNPSTTIRFNLPKSMRVEIAIYDLHGQQIRNLFSQAMQPGEHTVAWDGRNDAGELVASGVYFYRLQAGDFVQSRKMVFVR